MRRSDREVTEKVRIEAFLAKEQVMRIAFYDNGDIYIVPVNYGFSCEDGKYTLYFHGAKAGRKYELSKSEPSVGFEIDGNYQLLESETACDFSAAFQSVTGTGTLHLLSDKEDKMTGLNAIMKQLTHKTDWHYEDKMIEVTAVFQLDVEKISCKAK